MQSNITHRWKDIEALKRGEMIYPSFVDFHSTNVCNQHCVGCAYDGMLETQYMPEAKHVEIVNELLDVGVRAFDFAGGGEPTLLPYLGELMGHIAEKGANFALITNGVKMAEDVKDALLRHGTYLRVSLEASNAETYASYKKVNIRHWSQAIGNIREMVSRRNAMGSKLEVSVKFLVGKSINGYQHHVDLLNLSRDMGVDLISVKALRHEPEELPEIERDIEERTLESAIRFFGKGLNVRYKIRPTPLAEVPQCWLTPVHTVVDWDGSVYICCYYYYRHDAMKIGNLNDSSFKDLWFTEHHKKLIAGIKREECQAVDCKFYGHHKAVDEAARGGSVFWI